MPCGCGRRRGGNRPRADASGGRRRDRAAAPYRYLAAAILPCADPGDWYTVQAGQRAQLVEPDGTLTFGTELVTGADGTIAGLLGASPGASTAPSIMIDLLARCFPAEMPEWEPRLRTMMPALAVPSDSASEAG